MPDKSEIRRHIEIVRQKIIEDAKNPFRPTVLHPMSAESLKWFRDNCYIIEEKKNA